MKHKIGFIVETIAFFMLLLFTIGIMWFIANETNIKNEQAYTEKQCYYCERKLTMNNRINDTEQGISYCSACYDIILEKKAMEEKDETY